MTDTQKPEALHLAETLEWWVKNTDIDADVEMTKAAACLRRLQAENEALREDNISIQEQNQMLDQHLGRAHEEKEKIRRTLHAHCYEQIEELLAALDLIANTGMDAGQCRRTARAAMKEQP